MFKNGGRKMKKVLLGIMFVMALFLVGCENPLDKMKETADAAEAIVSLEKNIPQAESSVTALTGKTELTAEQANNHADVLIKTLTDINTALKSDIVNKVLVEYAAKFGGAQLDEELKNKVLNEAEKFDPNNIPAGTQLDKVSAEKLTQIKAIAKEILLKL